VNNIYFMIIRYNGLKKSIVDFIVKVIAEYESVKVKGMYFIEWSEEEKEEKLLKFYDHVRHDEEAVKNIMEVNGLIMVGIILYDNAPVDPPPTEKVSGKNWNMISIKRKVRNKFGNVIHLSDSTETALNEINNLLNMNRDQIDEIVKREGSTVKSIFTNSELAERFNKIKSGDEVLWTPEK